MAKPKQRGHGEGSIFQRKDGRWVAQITLEDGRHKLLYGKTRKEVHEKLQKALYEQKQGTLLIGPQQTIKQYLEHWLEDVHKSTVRISTYVRYRNLLDLHILPGLGSIQLQKLTPQQVQTLYARKLKEGLSARSVRLLHAVLHKAFDTAVRTNLVTRNVCNVVTPPRLTKYEIQPLSEEQARMLLEVARGHRLEALLTLAITTGMRRGELLALRWQDLNFDHKSLQILRALNRLVGYGFVETEPKTSKSRRKIILPDLVIDLLKQHRAHQLEERLMAGVRWHDQDLVFCNTHGGFLQADRLREMLQRLLKEAGLPYIRFHDLRHSAATILLSMGVHAKVVQELLGHSAISMTMDTYSHVLPSMHQEAMEKMDEMFGQK